MSAHTPGPWEVDFASPDVWDVITAAGKYALHPGDLVIVAEGMTHPNARLIAAAPDLLKACKFALVALKGRERDQFLRDAIAKAEAA